MRVHSSSSRNITAPSTQPSSIASPRASHVSQANQAPPSSSSRTRPEPIERPNAPLKPIQPAQRSRLPNTLAAIKTAASPTISSSSSSRVKPLTDPTSLTWTRARLEKERRDWWDTQVTGSPEIWGAIRLATQHLQAGEVQEAQTMLDVTGCTCPTGLVWRGVFDATGVQYKVPEWVVVEPEGIIEEDEVDQQQQQGSGSGEVAKGKPDEADDEAKDDTPNELFDVRVRTSHDSRDVVIQVRRKDAVARVVDRVKAKANVRIPLFCKGIDWLTHSPA